MPTDLSKVISDPAVAANVSALLLEVLRKFNDSLFEVQERCPDDEFKAYRRAVAAVLAEMYCVAKALYDKHPDLRPSGLFETGED